MTYNFGSLRIETFSLKTNHLMDKKLTYSE